MAKEQKGGQTPDNTGNDGDVITLQAGGGGEAVMLPGVEFIADAQMARQGADLVLQTPDGRAVIVEDYFAAETPPVLTADGGARLTPELVDSFLSSAGPVQYAKGPVVANDASPVGMVKEVSGHAIITHADGSAEEAVIGTIIYQNDVIETDGAGAVGIRFIDESSFAVSGNARLAVDEYVFDPGSGGGASSFSLLRGMFVFTSGLIGREDPDDVRIDTPVGSIGIRGTTIIGMINPGGESTITVTEGAIAVRNGAGEMTLSQQFETVKLTGYGSEIVNAGIMDQSALTQDYNVLRVTAPEFFSSIAGEELLPTDSTEEPAPMQSVTEPEETAPSMDEGVMDMPAEDAEDGAALLQQPAPEEGVVFLTEDAAVYEEGVAEPSAFEGQEVLFTATSDPAVYDAFTGTETFAATDTAATADTIIVMDTTNTATASPDATSTTTSTTSGTGGAASPNLLPLALGFVGGDIDETATGYIIVGEVFTTVNFPDVTFALASVSNGGAPSFMPLAEIDPSFVAPDRIRIILTADGEMARNADPANFSISFSVVATLPDGRSTQPVSFSAATHPDPVLPLELTTISTEGYVIAGSSGERLGAALAAWGDADGDGGADFLAANDSGVVSSAYEIINGSIGTPVTTNGKASLSAVGDFDGDGQIDYIVGDPAADDAIISAAAAPTFTGVTLGQEFGRSVAGVGDINGDGLSDVVIGAPGTGSGAGAAYVIFGGTSGAIDVTAMGMGGFVIGGLAPGDRLGSDVSAAGDFNRDGFADFAITEPGQGRVHIVFGGDGIAGATLGVGTMQINGLSVDPLDRHIPVTHVGDFNGDGISDIMLGATGANAGRGEAYIVYGKPVYGAGTSINVTSMTAAAGFKIAPPAGTSIEGGGTAGDFNGDGFDDAAIVMRTGDMADIYVIYGRAGMPGAIGDIYLDDPANAFHMTYDLSAAGLANPATDPFKFVVSSAGDADGDGFDDLAIGTPDANGGDGEVIVVYGRDASGTVDMSGADILSTGGLAGARMVAGAGDDLLVVDVDALGSIDGGTGFDTLQMVGAGRVLDFTNASAAPAMRGSEALSGVDKFDMSGNSQILKLSLDDIFRLLQESDGNVLKIMESGNNVNSTSFVIDDNGAAAGSFSSLAATLGFTAAGSTGPVMEADGFNHSYAIYNSGSYQLLIDQNVNAVSVV